MPVCENQESVEFSTHAHTHINTPFIQDYKTVRPSLLYEISRYPFYEINIHLKDALIPLKKKKKKTESEMVRFSQEMT